jgi:hypothetical protein
VAAAAYAPGDPFGTRFAFVTGAVRLGQLASTPGLHRRSAANRPATTAP